MHCLAPIPLQDIIIVMAISPMETLGTAAAMMPIAVTMEGAVSKREVAASHPTHRL